MHECSPNTLTIRLEICICCKLTDLHNSWLLATNVMSMQEENQLLGYTFILFCKIILHKSFFLLSTSEDALQDDSMKNTSVNYHQFGFCDACVGRCSPVTFGVSWRTGPGRWGVVRGKGQSGQEGGAAARRLGGGGRTVVREVAAGPVQERPQ